MPIELTTVDSVWPELPDDSILPRLNAHDGRWLQSVSAGLRQRPYLLIHRNSSQKVDGVLPLIYVRSLLFGRFLVSLPYLNTGGVWSADSGAATALITEACDMADRLQVRYLELRHESPIEHPQLNASRTDKVHMRLRLPDTVEALDASFKAKLRSQVKKSKTFGLTVHWGSLDLLDDFYDVFAVNMRDLGTPVFSKDLFRQILTAFGDAAELCIIRKDSISVAGGLLVHLRGVTEVPSASCLRAYNHLSANMFMYHNLLGRAIERGSRVFDFGRSSQESGTYKFKEQWGAVPEPANWQYYVRKGSANDMRADAEGKQRLVKIWQKLPVWFTRLAGPGIVRGIP